MRVLIDTLTSLVLEVVATADFGAEESVCTATVRDALQLLDGVNFALLDIDVEAPANLRGAHLYKEAIHQRPNWSAR